MHKIRAYLLTLFIVSVLSSAYSFASGPLLVDQNISHVDLRQHSTFLITDDNIQLSNVQNIQTWQTQHSTEPLAANKSLWGRVRIQISTGYSTPLFLTIDNPQLDLVDLYILDEKDRILNSYLMGANRDLSRRPYNHRVFVVPILPTQSEEISIYFKISDDGPLVFPITLSNQSNIVIHEQVLLAMIGLISGALVILACYFLVTYVLLRSPIRFWFAVSISIFLLLFLNLQGVIGQLVGLDAYSSIVSSLLIAILLVTTAKVSFAILEKVPRYWRYPVYALALIMLVCSFVSSTYNQILLAIGLLLLSSISIALLSLFYRPSDKKTPNTYYAIGLLIIAAAGGSQISLYLSGVTMSMYMSLSFPLLVMIGIMLIALSIEAHERVITGRHHIEQQSTISNLQHFYNLFHNSAEGQYTSTLEGKLTTINPAMYHLFGYDNEEQMLAHVQNTVEFYANPVDRELLLGEIIQHGVVLGKEVKGKRKDGSEFWFSVSAQIKQEQEQKIMFGSIFDITERKQSNISLEYLATHDSLTGVYNRREFERRLRIALLNGQNQKSELTLLYMDLDQFKVVNDTCGHKAGDLLIKQLSEKLNDIVSANGMLARLGGDEFAVLLEDDNAQMAYLLANKLLTAVQEFRFIWENRIFTLSISIGQVSWQAEIKTPEQLLNMADSACYMAKERGRNQVHTYSEHDEHKQRYESELSWVTQINHALENNKFDLYYQHYQPLSKTSEGHHYEILLRMHEQEDRLVPPGAFLPTAERYELAALIDRWVIEHYFDWLAANPQHLNDVSCANINLSGHSLGDKALKLFILNAFEKYSVPYDKICFEITESMAILKMDETLEFIETFRHLGCTFALDDFGSGFSSYSYLKNLPVDQVKIDGSFVKDMLLDPIDMAMVSSIKDVAKAMGIKTVAEFVESTEIMVELGKMGVDFAQGYGIAKPAALKEFTPYTNHHK
jgi:diguanylate cyclase (GGDEF)-like protein/PAS domain S-box-containing protein